MKTSIFPLCISLALVLATVLTLTVREVVKQKYGIEVE